jgi:hypothetical protein
VPLFPGPWQASPGPQTIDAAHTATGITNTQYELDNSLSSFATICEPAAVSGGYGAGGNLRVDHSGPPDEYTLYQSKVVYQIDQDIFLLPTHWSPPLPWPAGAVDWEWENTDAQLWVTSVDVSVPLSDDPGSTLPFREDVTLLMQAADPATLTLFTSGPHAGLPEDRPIPGAALDNTNATVLPAGTSSVTLTGNYGRADIMNIDSASGYMPLTVVISFDNMRTHVAPTLGMGRWLIVGFPPTCAVNFTPPQWRFLFSARPPFAHRQRRDGAATAGPQLAHIGTSGSRPPLAWRQNTP